MADTKISAMSVAPDVGNADVVPIVSAGANEKATRAQLLTAKTGEDISLVGAATQSVLMTDAGGTAVVVILPNKAIVVASPGKPVTVQYDPNNTADWNGTFPVKLGDAIDRCAALLKVLNGGVGP